ncbi:MAG: SUMF1/EgtB/PvdO family nonheme iron enzyme [Pseudomonadota bacterium]
MKNYRYKYLNKLVFLFFVFPVFICAGEIDPNTEYRVALVIGNSAYEGSPLRNPVNDAKDIAAALEELGFEVVLGTDLNREQINQKVSEFSPMLKKADIGFFYFAGHGFQYNGENYLVPVAFNINSENDIPHEALSTGRILKKMDLAGNAVNIVVLDACRNNPYADSYQSANRSLSISSRSRGLSRAGKKGLTRLDGPSGSFIAYATAPGNVAADGTGKNGLYTQYLLKYMLQSGMVIERVFKKVRIGVMKDTAGNQVPWENSSLLGDFYFVELDEPASKSLGMDFLSSSDKKNSPQEADKFELQFWNSVEKSQSPNLYKAYLKKYPKGHFIEIAAIQLEQLLQLKQQQKQQERDIIVQQKTNSATISVSSATTSPVPPSSTSSSDISVPMVQYAIAEKFTVSQINQAKPIVAESVDNGPFKAADFVKISSGCFTMGSAFGEEGRQNDELDHKVCISQDYMLGKYEVTQAQWKAVMGRNPAYFKGCGADCPVERVSWNDVQTFIFRLNLLSDKHYRLPSEAEWEYAARSDTNTSTYVGDIELEGSNNAPGLNKIAWYSGNTKVKYKGGKYCEDWDQKQFASVRCGTQNVGKKHPNNWGLYDMIGNVWELTNDWYGSFSSRDGYDPKGAKSGALKVAKGGNWADSLQQNRAAARYGFAVKEKVNNLGFRLVKTLD